MHACLPTYIHNITLRYVTLHLHLHLHLHFITLHYITLHSIHTYIHTYIYTYIYIHIHTYTYIYIHIHTYTYIYIHIHTYTYIYIHIHTYIHTYIIYIFVFESWKGLTKTDSLNLPGHWFVLIELRKRCTHSKESRKHVLFWLVFSSALTFSGVCVGLFCPCGGELATELHFFKEYALSVLHILCISWHIMQFEFYFVNSTSQPEVDQSCFQDVTVSK